MRSPSPSPRQCPQRYQEIEAVRKPQRTLPVVSAIEIVCGGAHLLLLPPLPVVFRPSSPRRAFTARRWQAIERIA